jgi:hypothetical protein
MIRFDDSHTAVTSLSNPGVIRNFRVQVRPVGSSIWRMHRTFRRRSDAESCIADLQRAGMSARLVDCDRCPTAI